MTSEETFDPEVKAKWLAALRSGKYDQGYRALRPTPDTFCFLGVLCDVLDPNAWDGDAWSDKATQEPRLMTDELSLHTERRLRFPRGAICTLMDMNDDQGKRFSEIADYIEANL